MRGKSLPPSPPAPQRLVVSRDLPPPSPPSPLPRKAGGEGGKIAGFVRLHPDPRRWLESLGLTTAAAFLSLEGEVVSGHPDRHVMRVTLPGEVVAYLKREHRVPWRDRLANALQGFRWVSKSEREAAMLAELEQEGVPAPEWLAYGAAGGRAFLLVRELAGHVGLREWLSLRSTDERCRLARDLGAWLARLHAAGFDHPDLQAKHVLVAEGGDDFALLDWQRARRLPAVLWADRLRPLALLNATLADELAGPRERAECLRAYLRAAGGGAFQTIARQIDRQTRRLLRRRAIRKERLAAGGGPEQRLLWLDGEAVCTTPECADRLTADLLRSLGYAAPGADRLTLPDGTVADVVRRRCWRLSAWLGRRTYRSPEVARAGLLFRLQRAGVATARLLAFGQRFEQSGFVASFLLTAEPAGSLPLTANGAKAGELLRRLHRAGFALAGPAADHPSMLRTDPATGVVFLPASAPLVKRRGPARTDDPEGGPCNS